QGTDDPALVTTARLKANRGDRERAQPCDQLGPAGCVVTHRKEPPLRQHHHIQAVLRHVDTAEREHGHLRIPSWLMRARALLLQATRTVPIVFTGTPDPVGAGFVESLARPGGNATGFTIFEYGISGKWLELLKEIAPHVTRAAVIRDPDLGR